MKLLTDPQEEFSSTSSLIKTATSANAGMVQLGRVQRPPKVALWLDDSPETLRSAIHQCARAWGWDIVNTNNSGAAKPDGAILFGSSANSLEAHPTCKYPAVRIRTKLEENHAADVVFDFAEAARLGAWKLMSLENMPLIFIGTRGNESSTQMAGAFQQVCTAAGRSAQTIMISPVERASALEKILTQVSSPIAIMADSDSLASQILRHAAFLGIRVPTDLAVLGCRDDSNSTHLPDPMLSSIDMDPAQAGQAAARLLRKWLRGTPPNIHPIRIPPRRIVEQISTRVPNTGGGCICRVVIKIRQDFSKPLCVNSLARDCGMSVRSLYRRYRNVTGTTISKHLMVSRIQAAAELLESNHLKLEPIAIETGLGNAKNLCRLFKEHFGVTPGQWRELFSQSITETPSPH